MYSFDEKQVDFATVKREKVLEKLNAYMDKLAKSWGQVNGKEVDFKWQFFSVTCNFKFADKSACQKCVEELQQLMKDLKENLDNPKEFERFLQELSKLLDNNRKAFFANDAESDFVEFSNYVFGPNHLRGTLSNDLKQADTRVVELKSSPRGML